MKAVAYVAIAVAVILVAALLAYDLKIEVSA